MRRVVVTGLGLVTPLGGDVETSWKNILASKSGAGPITKFDASDQKCRIACEVKPADHEYGFDPNKRDYEGVGLKFMAYRAHRAGAKLIIHSAPNQGTSVRCTLAKGAAHA